jgi:hypothetical protein
MRRGLTPTLRNLTGVAGCIADVGGICRHEGGAERLGHDRQASPGCTGTIEGLVIQAGAISPSRFARPTAALRV